MRLLILILLSCFLGLSYPEHVYKMNDEQFKTWATQVNKERVKTWNKEDRTWPKWKRRPLTLINPYIRPKK